MARSILLTFVAGLLCLAALPADEPKPIKILFLGDNAGHRPNDRFRQLQPVMAKRGIDLEYTDKADALNAKTLAGYDGLMIYANTTKITPEQEKALIEYVEGGKGFIPVHCASFCFLNSPKYIDLVGAQFKSHNTGTFRTVIAEPDHPLMKGFKGFESWDETYVHTKHNDKDRTVLEYRTEGDRKEPWTWVRTQGKGRVFYTAWGHDQRTWGNPGFHALLERGIRWATGNEVKETGAAAAIKSPFEVDFPRPQMTEVAKDAKPFEYKDVGKKIPNYTPGAQWGKQGEPLNMMQLPLPPEESVKHMVTPKGFHVELFADEKDLGGKPICMTWDERGRLWAAITMDYPNQLQPDGKGRDKIVICEDTKGTGRADKFTVFADKLSIPTSIAISNGGAIVYNGVERTAADRPRQAAQTLFLKSSKGDDVADVRKVLFGTWSQGDTHGGPSNMQYGLDNWIWGMQGYNDSSLTVGGETHRFRQGFYRFKPDASKMEFIRSTNNNTWGLGMSEEGIIFGSTANGCPSVYMPIPNRYYESVRGWTASLVLASMADSNRFLPITERVRQVDWHGGYTAAAGHALYTARAYPKEYWNRVAFVNEPTGHLVAGFVIRRQGSDFRSNNSFNLLASNDEWTAPIMSEVGPDGNVWVSDWYNFIVQHNPTPAGFQSGKGAAYESELRDKTHGRIYRIVYDGPGAKKETKPFTLAGATPEKLVATLKNDNLFWRRHAQRLLVERGKPDVLPGLIALAKDQDVDEIGLNVGAIHALWTMHGLGALDGKNEAALAAAVAALGHPSPGVRRNAVQVLPHDEKSVKAILAAKLPADDDPHVRLLALLTLADQPASVDAGKAVVAALLDAQNATDRWIPDAATAAAANDSEPFLKALSAVKETNPKLLAVAGIVSEHYARGAPVDSVGGVLTILLDADPKVVDAVVRGLAKGWPVGKAPALDEKLERTVVKLAARVAPERRGALVKMVSSWGSKNFEKLAAEARKTLLAQVKDEKLSAEERNNAARELIGQDPANKEVVQTLLDLITPQTSSDLAAGFLQAIQGSDVADAGEMILDRLPTLKPSARAAGLSTVLVRAAWTRDLLERAEQGKFQLNDLALDQKQALTEYPLPSIRDRARGLFKRGGVLPNPDREKVLQELLAITKETGDAKSGKEVFVKNCSKCHVHGGEGTRIGPDLTGMAVHPKDHLLADIIDPSRNVEANYRAYQVTLKNGRVLSGLLASESKTAIEIYDAEGKRQAILLQDIDELVTSKKSLMPDGFEKQVTRKELTDLLEFLTQRGKYLPLPLDKAATVVSTRGMLSDENNRDERLVFPDWKPKTFDGVPFNLIDPQGDKIPNVVMLQSKNGKVAEKMPRAVSVPCNAPAKTIHLLSGVSGWGYASGEKGSVSMIVRLHYADGKTEDHELKNGEHFADFAKRTDVPGSKFAFDLGGKQVRYLAVTPQRKEKIETIEFVKGRDNTAPVVMAVTVEIPDAGAPEKAPPAPDTPAPPKGAASDVPALKEVFKDKFLIGTAFDFRAFQKQTSTEIVLATTQFSAMTPENSMKPASVQATEGRFTFDDADRLVALAEKNGATPIGHCLVWHSQTPRWFFQGTDGKPADRDLALERMRKHIATVVGHYKGRVKQWDVVNEAISDSPDEQLRKSPWLTAIGEDYLAEAFRAAHEADPDAVLVYNDYGIERKSKRVKALKLLKSLLDKKVPVHAVGMQCHWRMDSLDLAEVEESIKQFADLGLKIMITELDLSVLPARGQGADISKTEPKGTNPYTEGLPEDVAKKQAELYGKAFAMFLRHKKDIGRVTFWGTDDGRSWLNNFPVRGRTDYPLLFDRQGKPKAAFFAVTKAAQEAIGDSPKKAPSDGDGKK